MGLDITAYSHLKPVGKHVEDWCEDDNHVEAYAYDDFPNSFRGIPIIGGCPMPDAEFLYGGCYEVTEATETHRFRAGSYSGYNAWRADLRNQFNPKDDPDGPFYELICFADNEGTIGPEAAKDLLEDFRANGPAYKVPGGTTYPDWWSGKYADWTRAFELAAADGLVDFH